MDACKGLLYGHLVHISNTIFAHYESDWQATMKILHCIFSLCGKPLFCVVQRFAQGKGHTHRTGVMGKKKRSLFSPYMEQYVK